MRRLASGLGLVALAASLLGAVAERDVVFRVEFEAFGAGSGLRPVTLDGATGGTAVALGEEDTSAGGAVDLEPGDYTLLLRSFAPNGGADAYFVEVNGRRERLKAVIGKWATVPWVLTVAAKGPVTIQIIGQETGCAIDQIALVRGRLATDRLEFGELPAGPVQRVAAGAAPRAGSGPALAALPDAPFTADADTALLEHFDGPVAAVSGEHHAAEGKFGGAVSLDAPDGRYEIDVARLGLGATGTVEFWVRPRPAMRLWHDQGWHYFVHLAPQQPDGFQLDLSRHVRTKLRLTASRGVGPYDQGGEPRVDLAFDTDRLDLEAWHHLLVSWDLSGDPQRVWLLVDGRGSVAEFPRQYEVTGFRSLTLGNTPPGWKVPYLPVEGAFDELRVLKTSVAARLQP